MHERREPVTSELREAFGVRGACSHFSGFGHGQSESAGKPAALQTLRDIAAIADE